MSHCHFRITPRTGAWYKLARGTSR